MDAMTQTLPPHYGVNLAAATRLAPQPDRSAQVLSRAADVLIRDGWCQGDERDEHGRRCLINAVATAAGELCTDAVTADLTAREWIHDVLDSRYPDFDGHIDHWQDADGRSLDDVLDVIAAARAAIGGARA